MGNDLLRRYFIGWIGCISKHGDSGYWSGMINLPNIRAIHVNPWTHLRNDAVSWKWTPHVASIFSVVLQAKYLHSLLPTIIESWYATKGLAKWLACFLLALLHSCASIFVGVQVPSSNLTLAHCWQVNDTLNWRGSMGFSWPCLFACPEALLPPKEHRSTSETHPVTVCFDKKSEKFKRWMQSSDGRKWNYIRCLVANHCSLAMLLVQLCQSFALTNLNFAEMECWLTRSYESGS